MWTTCLFVLISSYSIVAQIRFSSYAQYDRCSSNAECGWLPLVGGGQSGLCVYLWTACSLLMPCEHDNVTCAQPHSVCIKHPRCHHLRPVCYPLEKATEKICPDLKVTTTTFRPPTTIPSDGICASTTWAQDGITVAGGFGNGYKLNQIHATDVYLNDDGSMYISDFWNDRVLKWEKGATSGRLVAGGNGRGNQSNQVSPASLVVAKDGTLIICDSWHNRVIAWTPGASNGKTMIGNIGCNGFAMDNQSSLYVSDWPQNRVRKWHIEDAVLKEVASVAFGLETPSDLFVDHNRTVYIVQWNPHRVVKWQEGASQGDIVAGGNGAGNDFEHLSNPSGVVVDQLGTSYILEAGNDRITKWPKGAKMGTLVAGGKGRGSRADQLNFPSSLRFDRQGNLFVVDFYNYRIQMFAINKSSCEGTKSPTG